MKVQMRVMTIPSINIKKKQARLGPGIGYLTEAPMSDQDIISTCNINARSRRITKWKGESFGVLSVSIMALKKHCPRVTREFPFLSGGLVRKILETKKELEGGRNQETRPKQVRDCLLWTCPCVRVIYIWKLVEMNLFPSIHVERTCE